MELYRLSNTHAQPYVFRSYAPYKQPCTCANVLYKFNYDPANIQFVIFRVNERNHSPLNQLESIYIVLV